MLFRVKLIVEELFVRRNIVSLILLCVALNFLFSEVIVLKDESIIKGKIIKLDEDNITVIGSFGEMVIERDNIKMQYQNETQYNEALEKLKKVEENKTIVLKTQIILLKNKEVIKGSIIENRSDGILIKVDDKENLLRSEDIEKVYFSEEDYYKEKYANEAKEKVVEKEKIVEKEKVVVEEKIIKVDTTALHKDNITKLEDTDQKKFYENYIWRKWGIDPNLANDKDRLIKRYKNSVGGAIACNIIGVLCFVGTGVTLGIGVSYFVEVYNLLGSPSNLSSSYTSFYTSLSLSSGLLSGSLILFAVGIINIAVGGFNAYTASNLKKIYKKITNSDLKVESITPIIDYNISEYKASFGLDIKF